MLSLVALQAQVDAFDLVYNTERPHQGLPGRITPQAAWDATEVAPPPRPRPPTPAVVPPTSPYESFWRRMRMELPITVIDLRARDSATYRFRGSRSSWRLAITT